MASMAIPPHRTHSEDSPRAAAAQAASLRDAGVRRVRSATRWLAAGAVALTGVLAGVAAHGTASSSASTGGTGLAAAQSSGTASGYDDGSSYGYDDNAGGYGGDEGYSQDDGSYGAAPQAPAQAPQPVPQPVTPAVSSGAS